MRAPTGARVPRREMAAAALVSAAGAVMWWFLMWSEIRAGQIEISWVGFAVMTVLLLACQRMPSTWMTFGPIGTVTPACLFAFALMMLGSPSLAVGIAIVGATIQAMTENASTSSVVVTVGSTAFSLSTGGLVLRAFGVLGPITQRDRVPWHWALAIICAGASILLLNSLVASVWMAARRRLPFVTVLRRGIAIRVTAEGALLSLAPIWVTLTDFSIVLAPVLGVTTVLVFRSAREALERSHEALHDPLTGLQNRRSFLQQLGDDLETLRPGVRPTVLVMDLDGFKDINDRLGHQLGDALLVAFAERLEACLGESGTAARLGGDEFAVRLVAGDDDAPIRAVVHELHRALCAPMMVEGFPVGVGVSIGAAIAPDDGRTTSDLLAAADVAMYKSKRTGSSVEFYDNCVKVQQRGRLHLLSDLGYALDDHQFLINYQPQLRVDNGSVDTVEALIRWQHPTHGLIAPNEFIGLAEQTDLIGPLTHRVLRLSTQGLMTGEAADLRLAVNVSARSLQDPQFAGAVFEVLSESGFAPDRLELEVTERTLVTHAERTNYTIQQLRSAGVRIAIDDFGIGYSSYQTLRMLEVDRVKIDREFVQDILTGPRDRTIVASLIRLAHDLGLDVVAEGVESEQVWQVLADLGCDVAQGFGIAVPMAYPELRGWLADWNVALAGGRQPVS